MATKDTDPVVPDTQPRTSQGEAASGLPEAVVFPYTTPVPAPTTNGANGFRWCHECQSVADVAGHECAMPGERPLGAYASLILELEYARAEVEAVHSLLCTMAFDHCRDELHCVAEYGPGCPPVEWFENNCGRPGCVFCDAERAYDAARGGGR